MTTPKVGFLALLSFAISAFELPEGPIIAAYQNWGACNATQSLAAAEQGVNVIIWFAINLVAKEEEGTLAPLVEAPVVESGPNYTCVGEVRDLLEAKGLHTAHLISIGGWDAPHPNTSFTGSEWFVAWQRWNWGLPKPFDGFDWDLEGNDAPSSPWNEFTPEVMNLVVDMSTDAKKAGFIVTMVPAQSYFDSSTSDFNLSLRNAYADWHPDFQYHGRNCYMYLLAAAPANTFDLISVQLYETWSRADQALIQKNQSGAAYLESWTRAMLNDLVVDFGNQPSLRVSGKKTLKVTADQLVIALSFGDSAGKSAFFWPDEAGKAYTLAEPSWRPRGYAFWNILMDGSGANGTKQPVNFATGLNEFLHVRHNDQYWDHRHTNQVVVV